MNWWNTQVKVGVVVLLGFILLVVLLMNASNSPWSTGGDLLSATFSFVGDLRVGAAVSLAGVQIGKVTSVELDTTGTSVLVEMRVKDAFRRLRKGCKVEIIIIGFVGEAYINLTNGPTDEFPLQPTDLPLNGIDPVGFSGLLEAAENGLKESIALVSNVNKLLQANQETITESVSELKNLVLQTSTALETLTQRSEQTVDNVNRIARDNDFRLEQTFRRLNRLIDQLENDSLLISSQATDLTRRLLDVVNRNAGPVNRIVVDLEQSATNFRATSERLNTDLVELKSQLSEVLTQSQETLETTTPKFERLLDNATAATEDLDDLKRNLATLIEKAYTGSGSVAKLLNDPEAVDTVQKALTAATDTMGEIRALSQTLNQRSKQLVLPTVGWDYELRYLSFEEHLHNELAVLFLASPTQRFRLGVSTRQEDVSLEFQYGYDVTGNLRARAGFMRSKVGLGVDLWLLSRRLGLTVEGTALTDKDPVLGVEMAVRPFPLVHIILGAENVTDDISYTAGLRFSSANW